MKRTFDLILLLLWGNLLYGQYAPPAGQQGSDAIHKDSSIIVGWASYCEVSRGWVNIADTTLGTVTYGDSFNTLGMADLSVVSLGDGGCATLTFEHPIHNGQGPDFAVFENSFNDTFLELAFVEVSSDGINFVRFPCYSHTDTMQQIGGFGSLDATKLHGLAGKYRGEFGVPFDLDLLKNHAAIDINHITHVRVCDVIGSLDPRFRTYDSDGNPINDPYPTPFASGGFDLDAVGVIHWGSNSLQNKLSQTFKVFPNPLTNSEKLIITAQQPPFSYIISDFTAKIQLQGNVSTNTVRLDLNSLPEGVYLLTIENRDTTQTYKIIKGW